MVGAVEPTPRFAPLLGPRRCREALFGAGGGGGSVVDMIVEDGKDLETDSESVSASFAW